MKKISGVKGNKVVSFNSESFELQIGHCSGELKMSDRKLRKQRRGKERTDGVKLRTYNSKKLQSIVRVAMWRAF